MLSTKSKGTWNWGPIGIHEVEWFQPKRFLCWISKEKEGFSAAAIYVLIFLILICFLFWVSKAAAGLIRNLGDQGKFHLTYAHRYYSVKIWAAPMCHCDDIDERVKSFPVLPYLPPKSSSSLYSTTNFLHPWVCLCSGIRKCGPLSVSVVHQDSILKRLHILHNKSCLKLQSLEIFLLWRRPIISWKKTNLFRPLFQKHLPFYCLSGVVSKISTSVLTRKYNNYNVLDSYKIVKEPKVGWLQKYVAEFSTES